MTKVTIFQPRTNRVSVNEQDRNTIRSIGLKGGSGGGADVGPAYNQANNAFTKANTANVLAFQASTNAAAAFAQANSASVIAVAAFDEANTVSSNSIPEAPTDGNVYGRHYDAIGSIGEWRPVLDMAYGGIITGDVYFTRPAEFDDTAYFMVDAEVNGNVIIQSSPKQATHATNKQYVDGKVAGNTKQTITTSGSTLSVNYALSNYAIINLAHNITAFSVTSWPTAPARLTLEIRNTGAFGITFPTGYLAADGQPMITAGAGKRDMIVLTSAEAGANIFIHVVGQNFILL